MPSDLALKTMNAAHRVLLKVSFGKLGWKTMNMPVLELTTIGRKSGEPRSVMLTSPVQQGDDLIIVASRGGDDTHPAWFLNLRDRPEVQVALGGGARAPYTASVLPDDERDVLWPQVEAAYKGYAGYQRKTERKIPLIRLSPAA